MHDPLQLGIWPRLLVGDTIDSGQWLRAKAAGEFIGRCRRCGELMLPGAMYQVGQIEWFEARCTNGHEVAAPGGRVLARSSRHSEQPAGWWDERSERLGVG